jgi:hypothetical protein
MDTHRRRRPLPVPQGDLLALRRLLQDQSTPPKVRRRAAIVLEAAEGLPNSLLARRLGTSRPTVLLWQYRYLAAGLPGLLREAPRSGRPRKHPLAASVATAAAATMS